MNPSITYLQEDLLLTIPNLPLEIQKSKKSKYHINMNVFMRSHYTEVSKMKKLYQKYVQTLLPTVETYTGEFKLLFVYYRPNLITRDLSNMVSVIDKFTVDVLTQQGIIPDDSVSHIKSVHYYFGGTKKDSHYVDLYLFKHKETIDGI